jgi:hypothetical protein
VYFLMVAGSIATGISDLVDDPSSVLTTLGTALPSISVLFINYAISVTLIQNVADMLRIPVMFMILFYRYFFNEKNLTRRQVVNGPLEEEALDYGVVLPKQLYLMVLVITYWTIAPFLMGASICAFASTYLRFKYKMLYVHVPSYEAGGYFWYGLYKYTMYALVASTVTMIAYLGIKEGVVQAVLLLPLLYVIFKAWTYTESRYKDMSLFVAYSNAVEADCSTYASPGAADALLSTFHADFYKQPYFSEAQIAQIQPYRIDGTPLFTASGALHPVYYKATVDDYSATVQDLETTPPRADALSSDSTVATGVATGYRPPEHIASSSVRNPMAGAGAGAGSASAFGVQSQANEDDKKL